MANNTMTLKEFLDTYPVSRRDMAARFRHTIGWLYAQQTNFHVALPVRKENLKLIEGYIREMGAELRTIEIKTNDDIREFLNKYPFVPAQVAKIAGVSREWLGKVIAPGSTLDRKKIIATAMQRYFRKAGRHFENITLIPEL